ncbi:MAG: hypothetical protein ACE5GM_09170 [bacterium]
MSNRLIREERLEKLDDCLSRLKRLSVSLSDDFGRLKDCLYAYESPLESVCAQLKNQPPPDHEFRIPGIWLNQKGEISINPYGEFRNISENGPVDPELEKDDSWSLCRFPGENPGNWMRGDLIYEAFLPLTSAWDHTGRGFYNVLDQKPQPAGTFLKTGLLIPLLTRMRVRHFYCLPFCRGDGFRKKGEKHSPYAVYNPFALDGGLSSGWINGQETAGLEAAALIELFHRYGIRFSFDIIPRTTGRNSAFLLEHPDWFYWVKTDRPFKPPPALPGYPMVDPVPEHIKKLYRQSGTKEYIEQFSRSPDRIDPDRWRSMVEEVSHKENILERIEREFGLTTAPAFSDCINDPQPLWDDVTYWRSYLDHSPIALDFLGEMFGSPENAPPYLFPDVIKNSLYPGEPNYPLWDMISEILPFYNLMLGLDGIRLDMGHALSHQLLERIIKRSREADPDFGINAENLNPQADREGEVTRNGAQIFTGNFWWACRRRDFIRDSVDGNLDNCQSAFSVAAPASHDTSRPVVLHEVPDQVKQTYGGPGFSRVIQVAAHFIPQAVPSILTGDEVFERQPINRGLDHHPEFDPLSPADDPRSGRLPLFNHSYLDWLHPDGWAIVQIHPREYEEQQLRKIRLLDQRRYGSTLLHFYESVGD